MGGSKGEEREKKGQQFEELRLESFPDLRKEMGIQIQEAQEICAR